MKKITFLIALFLSVTAAHAQFPEGFEGGTFPPTGWATFIGADGFGTLENWQQSTDFPATGAASAYVSFEASGNDQQDWLVTPQFTLTAAAPYLVFSQAQDFGTDYGTTYQVLVSTSSQTDYSTFVPVLTMSETDFGIAYTDRQVDLSAYIGVPIYVAFLMTNNDGDSWYIDDVRLASALVTAPSCASNPTPADAAVNVPYGAITLSWTAPTSGDAPTSYDLYAGNSPTTLQYVTSYTGTDTGTDLSITAYDATVYWQAVPVNAAGAATGCAVWSFTTESAPGYCLNADYGQYPTDPFTPSTCDGLTPNVIVTNGYASEYSMVNVTSGQTYTFTSSVDTDFITIGNEAGDTSMAAGVTPLTWVSDVDGPVRFYTHTDSSCGAEIADRTRSVICGTLTADSPDYVNLQYPASGTIVEGTTLTVYGQVYEAGLTDVEPGLSGQAAGIQAWVGVNADNTDPSTWTESSWTIADFNSFATGNNDEYMAAVGNLLNAGTYYYATRFRLNGGQYVYGGTDGTNGNFWDGTTFNSGVLTVTPAPAPANDECTGAVALTPGGDFAAGAMTTTNLGATDTDGFIPSCQAASGENVWYSVVVPASGSVTLETGDVAGSPNYDTVMSVFSGTCGTLTEILCDDDSSTNGNFSLISITGRTPGEVLYVSVWRYTGPFTTGDSGQFQISAYDASLLGVHTVTADNFTFYPNPVKNVLHLSNTQDISKVAVYNLLGQLVISKSLNSTEAQVDMSAMPRGTYLVKVTVANEVRTLKVIKD